MTNITDKGLTPEDLKAEKSNSVKSKIISFKQFSKILGRKKPNDDSPSNYAEAAKTDLRCDESSSKCPDCGSDECHCELSDEQVDKLVDSATDDDFADAYEDNEFAELDSEGNPINEAEELKKILVHYRPKGSKEVYVKTYAVPKHAKESDVEAAHKRSFEGTIVGVQSASNEAVEDETLTFLNEVLSREERIRQGARFALSKAKRERKRIIALHRYSGGKVVAKRARRMAVNLLKKRLLKGRDISKLSVGEKERIEARIGKMKTTLARISVKLVPKIRKLEKERLTHPKYTKKD